MKPDSGERALRPSVFRSKGALAILAISAVATIVGYYMGFGYVGDPGSPEVGVTLAGDAMVLGVVPCKDFFPVESVVVKRSKDDDVAWQVDSSGGSNLRRFVVGETPFGFDEVVPLRGSLTPSDKYVVVVELQHGNAVGAFSPGALKSDSWLVNGDVVPASDFDRYEPPGC